MTGHRIVDHDQWIVERKGLLVKEKEFTRLRDGISRMCRELPWEKVDKEYVFESPGGQETFADLFEGRSQLIVYHFMFGPDWTEGCKSCSFLADHYNPAIIHLNNRDVTMVTVSRGPLDKLEAFKKRMGWTFKWVSSLNNDFNRDYQVTFTPEEREKGNAYYNYGTRGFPSEEAPGISVFYRDKNGAIFHTYSSYSRGLDIFINAYNLLDIVPKGRDEDRLSYSMEWVRHHDKYPAS